MEDFSLGLKEALVLISKHTKPLGVESVPLADSVDRVAAQDIFAMVDSPSLDCSRKDGYAVLSRETANASPNNPVRLSVLGSIAAGEDKDIQIKPGATVRVLTGARIPTGADAVVPEEVVRRSDNDVLIEKPIDSGRDILRRGSDVSSGECILQSGQEISPVLAGLLAAAGHSTIPVRKNPTVGFVAIGDELVGRGEPLPHGMLYESNTVIQAGWCSRYGMKTSMRIVKDDHAAIFSAITVLCEGMDAVITSGGAWTGDFDMVAQVLDDLGWKKVFHRIRIGPGKGAGFGILNQKPVFVLSGGPPSNLMGFLEIALPGLLALSGHPNPGLPSVQAKLAAELVEGESDWTDFFFGTLEFNNSLPTFHPMKKRSRLSSIAKATAVAAIPEGRDCLPEGSIVSVQLLR